MFLETCAPPILYPFRPASSINFPHNILRSLKMLPELGKLCRFSLPIIGCASFFTNLILNTCVSSILTSNTKILFCILLVLYKLKLLNKAKHFTSLFMQVASHHILYFTIISPGIHSHCTTTVPGIPAANSKPDNECRQEV